MPSAPPYGFLPAPPPDGGFLVLNDAQISNLDLVCAIKSAYPGTQIYAQQKNPDARAPFILHREQEHDIRGLSREARRVMAIGNPSRGPAGIAGYYARRFPDSRRVLIAAMDKIKANLR